MLKRALLVLVLPLASCKSDKPDAAAPAQPASPPPTASTTQRPAPSLPPDTTTTTPDRPQQGRRMRNMDKDGDGVVSDEERAAARKERTQSMYDRLDTNHDGKLTPDELAAATGRRMHFDDPKALDTNGDGVISIDELQAGMDARRAQRRAQRNGGGSDTGGSDTGTP